MNLEKGLFSVFIATGSPLIGRKNGSIFLTNRLMRTVNKTAVLWEDLKNLLNKAKPSYREIRPMRGLLVSQDPENICKGLEERDDTSLTFFVIFFKKLHRFAKTDYCKYNWSDLWPFWTSKSVGRDSVVRKIAPYPKIEA